MARFRSALPATAGLSDEGICRNDCVYTMRNHALRANTVLHPGPI